MRSWGRVVCSLAIALPMVACGNERGSPAGSSGGVDGGFRLAWSYDTGAATSAPTVEGDTVFAFTRDGRVMAFPVACGDVCEPSWTADTGQPLVLSGVRAAYEGLPTQYFPPLVTGGLVVVTSHHPHPTMFAFDVRCGTGGATCTPAWTANGRAGLPPIAGEGSVYWSTERDGLGAFPSTCARDGSSCTPGWAGADTWWPTIADGVVYSAGTPKAYDASTGAPLWSGGGRVPEGSLVSGPTVGGGIVVTTASTSFTGTPPSRVFAYAVGCATGGETCEPLWTATTQDQFLTLEGVAIADGRVFLGTETWPGSGIGHALAYQTDCRTDGGRCRPTLDTEVLDGEIEMISPVVAEGQVLYTSLEGGGVVAFATDAGIGGRSSAPLWRTPTMFGPTQPVVADGVAYIADNDGNLYAFDTGCSTTGAVCQPIAHYRTPDAAIVEPPAVAGGFVFVGTRGGQLLAFQALSAG